MRAVNAVSKYHAVAIFLEVRMCAIVFLGCFQVRCTALRTLFLIRSEILYHSATVPLDIGHVVHSVPCRVRSMYGIDHAGPACSLHALTL